MTTDFASQTRDILCLAVDAGPGAALRLPAVTRAGGLLFAAMSMTAFMVPSLAEGLAVAGAALVACAVATRFVSGRNKAMASGAARPADGIFHVGTSLSLGKQIWLTADECKENLIVSGRMHERTGTCLSLAADVMAAGAGLIYCDGKGDVSLYARMYGLARRLGREDDLLVLNFTTTNSCESAKDGRLLSHTLNPFTTGSADALTQMVVSLMDEASGDGAMWKGRAVALFTGVMRALVWKRDEGLADLNVGVIREHLNLAEIIKLADEDRLPEMPAAVRRAVYAYLTSLPGYVKEKGVKQSQTTLDQHGFLQMQFTKILGSLADVYGHIFLASKGQVDMGDVALNRRILVVMLPALANSPDEVSNLGKIVVATLKVMIGSTLVGSKIESGEATAASSSSPPLTVIFDDFEHYTVSGMGAMARLAYVANVCFVFGCNSVEEMAPVDVREAKAVLAETGWRLEFVPDDVETAVLTHKGTLQIVRPSLRLDYPEPSLDIRVNHTI